MRLKVDLDPQRSIAHELHVADEQDVAATVVDGRVLMADGEMRTIDVDKVRSEATELAARIQASLNARNQ